MAVAIDTRDEAAIGGDRVELLALDEITPAADNPRRDVGDVGELAQSIASVGLLEPLLVTPREGGYLLVCGARRLAAARLAGLDRVPALVRDLDERQRQEAMLVENLQRTDLTVLEEAAAYRRLVELGHSQRELARTVGKSQSHISKRLALLELPERVGAELDSGSITLGDALELAKLKDDPGRLDTLLDELLDEDQDYRDFPSAVAYALEEREREGERAAKVAELEAAGVRIVGMRDSYTPPKGAIRIEKGGSWNALNLDPEKHATGPCHAAAVTRFGETVFFCTDRKRHPKAKTLDESARGRATGSEGKWREHDRQLNEARKARREFASKLLAGKAVAKGDALEEIVRGIIREAQQEGRKIACQLLALEPTPTKDTYGYERIDHARALAELAAKSERDLLRVGLAIALAGDEQHLGSGYYYSGAERRAAYFEFLERHGYEISKAERLELEGKGPRR